MYDRYIVSLYAKYIILSSNIIKIYNMAIRKVHYSFKRGFDKLKLSDLLAVRAEIMEAMGVKYNTEFYKKRNDYVNIPLFLKEEIDKIFEKYGVDSREIWDIWYEQPIPKI